MFGNTKPAVLYGALIDIGSGSVGVGIVVSDHTKKIPHIIFSERTPMRFSANSDNGEQMRVLKEAIFSASLSLSNTGLAKLREYNSSARVSRLLVTCSSPWSRTVTRTINFDEDKEFKITETLLSELANDAERQIAVDMNEETVSKDFGFQVVERATVHTKLNGYTVHDPVGLRAKTLELSQLTGFVPKEIMDSIHEMQEKVFEHTTLSVHTYLLVFYCVLRDIYPETNSFCIIDVSGEATEIGIVEDGILAFSTFVPYGSNTLIRNMCTRQGAPIEHSLSQIRAYQEQTLHEEEAEIVNKELEEYNIVLTHALEEIYAERHIPKSVVITALPEVKGIFGDQIMKSLASVTDYMHTVTLLEDHFIKDIAEDSDDVFLAIEGRFFHKLHGCGEID